MSLAVVFKGPEGLVLAADSRVTLYTANPQGQVIPAYFDSATKLLEIASQEHVGVVTYGAGAIGQQEPRTAHSFIPEFDEHLIEKYGSEARLGVYDFAGEVGEFYLEQWTAAGMPTDGSGGAMTFLVAGFDEGEAYGKVFEVVVPTRATPVEMSPGGFGVSWGGQQEITQRVINGFDPSAVAILQQHLNLDSGDAQALADRLKAELSLPIPYQFLPLQDCVDLAMYLVKMTSAVQTWMVGIRGVGGAIDVATITRTDGFRTVQRKRITGDS